MKGFILIDENKIVRCMATEVENLHQDKIDAGMETLFVEYGGVVGDEYDKNTETWTARPENYPQPSEAEVNEAKIVAKINETQRATAIADLITSEDLPADYVDPKL